VCLMATAYGVRCLGPTNPSHYERLQRYVMNVNYTSRPRQLDFPFAPDDSTPQRQLDFPFDRDR